MNVLNQIETERLSLDLAVCLHRQFLSLKEKLKLSEGDFKAFSVGYVMGITAAISNAEQSKKERGEILCPP